MESARIQNLIAPHGKAKIAPAGALAASEPATDTQKGFQALLLNLMKPDMPRDAAADTAQKTVTASEDTEHQGLPAAPAGVPDPTPLPSMMLPIALPPSAPESAAEPVGAGHALSFTHAAAEKRDFTRNVEPTSRDSRAKTDAVVPLDVEPGSRAPRPKTEIITPEKDLSRMAEGSTDMHAGVSVTPNPLQTLEALAPHRDTPLTNPSVPQFTQGLHLPPAAHLLPAAAARIETPVGAPEWNSEFAQKIVWLAGEKQHAAELHVNPPDLGPLHIRLSTDDNQTNAIFISPHSEVRESIEAALPRLREVLADSGITLGNASVTADSPRDGSAFDQQRHPSPSVRGATGTDATAEAVPAHAVLHSPGSGLVDLFA